MAGQVQRQPLPATSCPLPAGLTFQISFHLPQNLCWLKYTSGWFKKALPGVISGLPATSQGATSFPAAAKATLLAPAPEGLVDWWFDQLPAEAAGPPGVATPPTPGQQCWVLEATALPGGDLNPGGYWSSSPADCCSMCWETPGCSAWSHRASDVSLLPLPQTCKLPPLYACLAAWRGAQQAACARAPCATLLPIPPAQTSLFHSAACRARPAEPVLAEAALWLDLGHQPDGRCLRPGHHSGPGQL